MLRLWFSSPWKMDLTLFTGWETARAMYPTCLAWLFFLKQPLTATAGNRIMSYRHLCNPMQLWSCVTLPTCYREHTHHGPGFDPRFQAVKNYTLQRLTFKHLFGLIFVRACLQGEADEITCNTLEIDIVVSQFPFQKEIYHLLLLTAPSPCPLSCCEF